MAIPSGSRLGPYEVLDALGAGGMGEVYRARDPRLGREVAIKVLPAERLSDETRRRRFVQEARAASSLNHPNIVTIHEIERDGDVDFLVMELVAGKSLDTLIPRHGMPLEPALRIAIPVADALARAHAAGIVHRDLKPANVVVSDDGAPKVLDFGLAKLLSREDVSEGDTLTEETAAVPLSQTGAISGTPAYMSPEQASGKPVDARSDVFSFGSLLYELVTGRRPFSGGSRADTLAAVLVADPKPPGEVAAGVPPELEKLILRCLRKDPDRRFQHMSDVKVALEDVREESASGRAGSPHAGGHGRAASWVRRAALGAFLVLVVVLAAMWQRRSPTAPRVPGPLTQVTRDPGLTTDAAVSPAGNLLAYASDRGGEGQLDLWVQPFPQGEPIRLTRHEADDYEPSFSPDSSRIAFRSDRDGGGVYVVSALGGQEARLADRGRRPRFSPDGQWVAYYVGDTILSGGSVYIVPASGGTPKQVGDATLRARSPLWSPDGKYVLCAAFPTELQTLMRWYALSIDGRERVNTRAEDVLADLRRLFTGGTGTRPDDRLGADTGTWAPDGEHLVFSARSGDSVNIWEVGLSPKTWRFTTAARQLTFGTGVLHKPAVSGNRLLFTSGTDDVDLWSLPADARTARTTGPQRLTHSPGRDDWPSISADGRRLAFLSERSGSPAVWVKDLETQRDVAVTSSPTVARYPRISADGSKIAYLLPGPSTAPSTTPAPAASPGATILTRPAFQTGAVALVSVGPQGEVGLTRRLCDGCGRLWDWSRDGRYMALRGEGTIELLDVETGVRTDVARHPSVQAWDARFSPDDAWINFTMNFGALRRRIVVAPFRGPVAIPESDWVTVNDSETLDRQASWAADGSALYFHSERDGFRCLWAQRLEPRSKRPSGEPFPVWHFHGAQRSMTTAIGDPGSISVSAARDRIVFTLGATSGNIWMTTY